MYGEKQAGSMNVSMQESTYNGYSFYKPTSEISESCDCSLISTEYKINDLNTSKLTKETQKYSTSPFSSHVFEINEGPIPSPGSDIINSSPEPKVHKPHLGIDKKTKRTRNLEDFWVQGSKESETAEGNFIDEFLQSFDTANEMDDICEKGYFEDSQIVSSPSDQEHEERLQKYTDFLSQKMEIYSSF